jgi:hypothetical protein
MGGFEHNKKFVIKTYGLQKFFIGSLFFLLGFNLSKLYFPVFLLVLFFVVYKERGIRLSFNYLSFLALIFLAMILPFLVGYKLMSIERPIVLLAAWVFNLFFVTYLFFRLEDDRKIIAIVSYCAGLFAESMLVTMYSYHALLSGEFYGYGKLLHPISGMLINSPSVSNSMVPLTVIVLYRLFFYKFDIVWLLSFALLVVSIGGAFFLEGRAFFVCLLVALSIFLLFSSVGKKIFIVCTTVLLGLMIFSLYSDLDFFVALLNRFESGLESTRFEHYAYGLSQIFVHPFGGFNVNQNIESTFWFHNIFLDNSKYSGWITFFALLLLFLFLGLKLLSNHSRPYFTMLFCLYVVTFLLHQQDVVLEGNFRLFMVTMLCGLTVLAKLRISSFENKCNNRNL